MYVEMVMFLLLFCIYVCVCVCVCVRACVCVCVCVCAFIQNAFQACNLVCYVCRPDKSYNWTMVVLMRLWFSVSGNTSMDATLGFIMANMGQVKPNSLVFDPFVGTGM